MHPRDVLADTSTASAAVTARCSSFTPELSRQRSEVHPYSHALLFFCDGMIPFRIQSSSYHRIVLVRQ